MKSRSILRGLSLCALVSTCVADFYVATTGNDHSSGSESAPFATLERAQRAVRAHNTALRADLSVHVAAGTYYLSSPLNFTAKDSGSNGHRVVWEGEIGNGGVSISGGIPVTDWTLCDRAKGIWSAPVPKGIKSRHFFVDQRHAQRARQSLPRSSFKNTTDGWHLTDDSLSYLLTLPGLDRADFRTLNSFTDRVLPIRSVNGSTFVIAQPAWQNNIIGYDTAIAPFFDSGFYLENVYDLLDDEGEYFLDSTSGTIFYKPIAGKAPSQSYAVVAKLEQLLLVSGTYDHPVHDLEFRGLNFMHTTWNLPSTNIGYADQQTGSYIGIDKEYTVFEASRPFWYQVPGSVQASAAHRITFSNGSLVALMGGLGIGNDANAHRSGVGLGAQNVQVSGMYFSQTGSNAITVGGIQANAHHPSALQMVNANITITENIVTYTAATFKSAAGMLLTYTDGSSVTNNDLSDLPYSGICWGFGWGSNDAGGSDEYANRGLYNYQPRYNTPTTLKNGHIAGNLVQNFGTLLHDLAAIYTLSKSPNTDIARNYLVSGGPQNGAALYHDEGSRNYIDTLNVCNVSGNYEYNLGGKWFQANEQPTYTTGNLTAYDNAVAAQDQTQDGSNDYGDRISNTTQYDALSDLSAKFQGIVGEAGAPAASRAAVPRSMPT